jgi:hypothetical protein
VCGLIGKVCDGDDGKWKCAENVVGARGKYPRNEVPGEQDCNAGKREQAENNRESPMSSIKANVHT